MRALRNAVINHREGQAYLFSGPRGTGKTTSARILAKVLNCENPVDGEPCCECDSCLAVERGTSYDVHELDAASNNGVDAMRDLIEKASLGTPGRHKVYILDEVHMLSKAAEAALLKTLEEPPPHVVFVLATTDPQKVSATPSAAARSTSSSTCCRWTSSRTHIRWVAGDAGHRGRRGRAAVGAAPGRRLGPRHPVRARTGVGQRRRRPRDHAARRVRRGAHRARPRPGAHRGGPRRAAGSRPAHAHRGRRAPPARLLPVADGARARAAARRSGPPRWPSRRSASAPAAIVRAMERLGEMLVEMRHAPDPRLLLEVALVQLTHQASSVDMSVLLDRIERLEHQVVAGATPPAPSPRPSARRPGHRPRAARRPRPSGRGSGRLLQPHRRRQRRRQRPRRRSAGPRRPPTPRPASTTAPTANGRRRRRRPPPAPAPARPLRASACSGGRRLGPPGRGGVGHRDHAGAEAVAPGPSTPPPRLLGARDGAARRRRAQRGAPRPVPAAPRRARAAIRAACRRVPCRWSLVVDGAAVARRHVARAARSCR